PIGLLLGLFNVEVNFAIQPNLSVPVRASYFSLESGDDEFTMTGIGAGARYYFKGEAVNGWYVGGLLNYNLIKLDVTTVDIVGFSLVEYTGSATSSAVGYGALIGYQSIWDSGFTFDTGVGVQMINIAEIDLDVESDLGLEQEYTSDSFSGTVPIIQLSIGYAF
ncbi:DUF3575 domain-containing protein, partial [Elusimicrobiota bacterium]